MSIGFRKITKKGKIQITTKVFFLFFPFKVILFSLGKDNPLFPWLTVFFPSPWFADSHPPPKILYGKSAALNLILIALRTTLISVPILPSLCSSSITLMLPLHLALLINLQFCSLCLSILALTSQRLEDLSRPKGGTHVLKERKKKGRVILCMLIHRACKNWLWFIFKYYSLE